MKDADEPAAEPAEGGVVADFAGSLPVVVAAGFRRDPQSAEGMGLERVGQAVVADAAGLDGAALAGGPGPSTGLSCGEQAGSRNTVSHSRSAIRCCIALETSSTGS